MPRHVLKNTDEDNNTESSAAFPPDSNDSVKVTKLPRIKCCHTHIHDDEIASQLKTSLKCGGLSHTIL